MKRNILFLFMTILSLNCFSQKYEFPLSSDKSEIHYSEVVSLDSISKDLLFGKTKEWFVSKFISYKTICQLEDKTSGIIIVKPIFDVYSYAVGKTKIGIVEYTLKIQVKDGRYKYEIYDIRHKESKLKTPGNLLLPKPTENEDLIMFVSWDDIKKQSFLYFEKLIIDLKAKIKTDKSEDNW